MSKFTDLARLKELEKQATPAPWDLKIEFTPFDVRPNVQLSLGLRNAAPWLLRTAEAFQPGDAQAIAEIAALLDEVADISPGDRDLLRRLQAAAKEMER
jgi:hypothetical protein